MFSRRCLQYTLAVFLLLGLSACNLNEAQQPATIIIVTSPSQVQATAPALPTTQLITQRQPTSAPPVIQPTSQPPATAVPIPAAPNPFEDRTDPVLMLASFFNAISRRDYQSAYGYWESPPNGASLEQFAAGYANTAIVSGLVSLPITGGVAAGSSYATLRTALVAFQTNGSQQAFAGCYVGRKSNVPVGDSPTPDPNWRLYFGSAAASGAIVPALIDSACSGTPYDLDNQPEGAYDYTGSPITLIESYYDAINRREYPRAYGYWERPPNNASLADFTQGFASTASVRAFAGLSIHMEGAAGSIYASIPVVLVSSNTDGSQQAFAGCIVTRRGNVEPTDTAWRLYSGTLAPVMDFSAGMARAAQGCQP